MLGLRPLRGKALGVLALAPSARRPTSNVSGDSTWPVVGAAARARDIGVLGKALPGVLARDWEKLKTFYKVYSYFLFEMTKYEKKCVKKVLKIVMEI